MKKKEEQFKVKDLKMVCWNLSQKVDPFKITSDAQLTKQITAVRKECKCSELEALKILRDRLREKYWEMREHG